MEPLTGWPGDVLPQLIRSVRSIANNPSVQLFYIGRTTDLYQSRYRHGSDKIIPIYSTWSVDNAIDVEDALIQRFYDHPKCDNEAPHGGGGISRDYGSLVYVAIWF